MPSGITHMILSRLVLDEVAEARNGKIKQFLNKERGLYILGSVGPDLPYMPTPMQYKKTKELANTMHTSATNSVPLKGLAAAKENFKAGKISEAKALFAFYTGYCSHIVADGIIHPFVRDMVGDYEKAITEHQTLEVKLDVLIADKYFDGDCSSMDIHEELDFLKDSNHSELIFSNYAQLLNEIYPNWHIVADQVKTWSERIDTIFDVATGSFPDWYRGLMGDLGLSHQHINVVRAESKQLIELTLPKLHEGIQPPWNYMNKPLVNIFDDIIPQYLRIFPKVALSAYEYVFENGPEPVNFILEINLDTGRLLTSSNFNEGHAYGRLV